MAPTASAALLMLSTLAPGAQAQSWLVDDYATFNALVCSVIHNAQEQVRLRLSSARDPSPVSPPAHPHRSFALTFMGLAWQGAAAPPLCLHLPFMADNTLKTAVEEEKVLFSYGQVVRGCGEFARSHDVASGEPRARPCATGNDVCVAMERQARSSATLRLGHLFHRAAWVWKSGTDTYSGSSHNCHAYGLDGAAT